MNDKVLPHMMRNRVRRVVQNIDHLLFGTISPRLLHKCARVCDFNGRYKRVYISPLARLLCGFVRSVTIAHCASIYARVPLYDVRAFCVRITLIGKHETLAGGYIKSTGSRPGTEIIECLMSGLVQAIMSTYPAVVLRMTITRLVTLTFLWGEISISG